MAGWPVKGGTWAISRRSTHRSVIADLIGRWRNRNPAAKVASAERLTTLRKNLSQFIANAGISRKRQGDSEPIMLNPKG
jgi:hypothetical protein